MLRDAVRLDGQSGFNFAGKHYSWQRSGRLPDFSPDFPDDDAPHHITVTLSGKNWLADTLRFDADPTTAVKIVDSLDGGQRVVNYLALGGGEAEIKLATTLVRIISASPETEKVTLHTGAAPVLYAFLGDADTDISIGAGGILTLVAGNGNDNIGINGFFGALDLLAGRDVVRISGTDSGMLRSTGGSADVTLTDGATLQSMVMLDTRLKLTLVDGGIDAVQVEGNSRISLGDDGYIARLSLDGDRHQITNDGGIGTMVTAAMTRVSMVQGKYGGAANLHFGNKKDSLHVTAGEIDKVTMGYGDDLVVLSGGYVHRLDLGWGTDRLVIGKEALEWGYTSYFDGPEDDILDLRQISDDLTVDLSSTGVQRMNPSHGLSFYLSGFADVLGGTGNDRLTGNDHENRLVGGRGRDRLTGGAADDTFVFTRTSGRDTVTDFEIGADKLQFNGAKGLPDLTFAAVGDDVRIGYGRASVLVEDVILADLHEVYNFVF